MFPHGYCINLFPWRIIIEKTLRSGSASNETGLGIQHKSTVRDVLLARLAACLLNHSRLLFGCYQEPSLNKITIISIAGTLSRVKANLSSLFVFSFKWRVELLMLSSYVPPQESWCFKAFGAVGPTFAAISKGLRRIKSKWQQRWGD